MLKERVEALFRVVAIRDRFVEQRRVEIRELHLKAPERLAGVADDLEIVAGVEGDGNDGVHNAPPKQ